MAFEIDRRGFVVGAASTPLAACSKAMETKRMIEPREIMSCHVAEGPIAPAGAADNQFAAALVSPGPSQALGAAAADLDWLVGGWTARVRDFDEHGSVREGVGEWWFSWVLEGRALQDVWISPPRAQRGAPRPANTSNDRYGSTIRWFDYTAKAWRISWLNAVDGTTNQLAGSRTGDRMIFLGNVSGTPIRWSFNDIRAGSFVWRGETQRPDGSWALGAQFDLKRIA